MVDATKKRFVLLQAPDTVPARETANKLDVIFENITLIEAPSGPGTLDIGELGPLLDKIFAPIPRPKKDKV